MALTKISGGVIQPDNFNVGVITATSLNAAGVVTASTVQVGSATTIHTSGIDLGSGSITSHNINSTGIITASRYIGNADITGGSIVATAATFIGNVSIGGTLTYEDVTNIDSVGVITARTDVHVGAGLSVVGVSTFANGLIVTGGSVGIGTDNPSSILSIAKDSGNTILELKRTDTNTTGAVGTINWTASDGHSVANMYAVGDGDDEGAHLVFRTTSAAGESDPYGSNTFERLRIDSTGKIASTYDGIPSIAQYGQLELTKNGASNIDPNWSYLSFHRAGQIGWQQGIKDNDYVIAHTGGAARDTLDNERLRITSSGNVGIGTDNPQYKLEVQQPSTPTVAVRNTTTSSYSRLIAGGYDSTGEVFAFQRLGSTSSASGGPKAGQIWNYADAPIVMGIGSTERLRITSTGRIGIGVTNPDSLLHLKSTTGNVRHTIEVPDTFEAFTNYSAANSEFSIGYIRNSGTDHSFRFCYADGLSSGEIMRIDSANSRVGIGSTIPSYTLDVYGTFRTKGTANTNRYAEINSVGRILSNVTNNDNETGLILDNVGDLSSTSGHGSNILFRTNDNNSPSTAINSAKLSIVKSEIWTSTVGSRNSKLELSLAKSGTLQNRLIVNSYSGGAGVILYKRSSDPGVETRTSDHQYLFVEPDGDGPGYYRRSMVSAYKGQGNRYSYWALKYEPASYDYTGSIKCRITWSTAHASGTGYAEFSLAIRSVTSAGYYTPYPAGSVIQYGAVQFSGGWFYGWTTNPDFDVYHANAGTNTNYLVLRLDGYGNHNGGTYDLGLHETIDLESWGNATTGLYKIGTSAPWTLNTINKIILS